MIASGSDWLRGKGPHRGKKWCCRSTPQFHPTRPSFCPMWHSKTPSTASKLLLEIASWCAKPFHALHITHATSQENEPFLADPQDCLLNHTWPSIILTTGWICWSWVLGEWNTSWEGSGLGNFGNKLLHFECIWPRERSYNNHFAPTRGWSVCFSRVFKQARQPAPETQELTMEDQGFLAPPHPLRLPTRLQGRGGPPN